MNVERVHLYSKSRGFTLLEILIVLGLIGLIATVILPALRRTTKSAMMDGIRAVTTQATLTYDNAIFTGRIHRMVFDVKHGTFWTEIAPSDFAGRAPIRTEEFSSRQRFKDSLYKQWDDVIKNAESLDIPILEIPVHQLSALKDPSWEKLQNNLIQPQAFISGVVFASVKTGLSKDPVIFPLNSLSSNNVQDKEIDPAYVAYVYFFPSGLTTSASFQIGFRNQAVIDANAPKYTLNLEILTGRFKLLEGFQEANFESSE